MRKWLRGWQVARRCGSVFFHRYGTTACANCLLVATQLGSCASRVTLGISLRTLSQEISLIHTKSTSTGDQVVISPLLACGQHANSKCYSHSLWPPMKQFCSHSDSTVTDVGGWQGISKEYSSKLDVPASDPLRLLVRGASESAVETRKWKDPPFLGKLWVIPQSFWHM